MASGPKITSFKHGRGIIETGITKLKKILEDANEPSFSSANSMLLYSTIYDMCTQKAPYTYREELYEFYKKTIVDYIDSTVLPSLREKHDEFMLKELLRRWQNHIVMTRWLSRFFSYLDRFYVPKHSFLTLGDVGLTCFREMVYEEMCVKAKNAIIALINEERDGGQIDRSLLKNVLNMFIEMDMFSMDCYENGFVSFMLDDTAAYYSRKATVWLVEDSCSTYMLKAEECLKKEKERVTNYLHSCTEQMLIEKVQHELLFVYETQLLEKEHSGCRVMLKDDKVEDLSRMYRLYQKVPNGLEPIGSIFKQHIIAEGMTLVQQAQDAKSSKADNVGGSHEQIFVRKVIELHDKFSAYVNDCFANHAIFRKALKEGFDTFLNKSIGGSSIAELLATFCDSVLKKGGIEKLSDDDIEDSLDKVVKILAHVNDKDLFAEFYRKKLSRRLLFDKSGHDDHERSFLTKLKQQNGGTYTSKMEGMVTDLTLARENQSQFEDYLASNIDISANLDLTVTVLTTGFWPTYKTTDLHLPEEMVKCVNIFKQFYETKTKHRKLTWIYSLGSCNINAKFASKTIELVLLTYQAAALMLFNTSDKLAYSEIMTQLNLGDEDLSRVLQSLSCAKYKILIKEPNTRTVSHTDTFTYNSKFTDRMRRIRIPLPPMDERKKTVEDVDKDRRYHIDASIVRIMKSRKALAYQQLITECVEQLSRMFKPEIKAIKKRIEDLITRDYIERDKKNPNMFRYLA